MLRRSKSPVRSQSKCLIPTLFHLLLVILLLVHDSQQDDSPAGTIQLSTDGLQVTFDGINPQFIITPTSDMGLSYRISFTQVEELDEHRVSVPQHQVPSLKAEKFTFTGVNTYTVNNTRISNLNMSTVLDILSAQVPLQFNTYVYKDMATETYGDRSIDIPRDSLRLVIMMNHWPFNSLNNSLRFFIEVGSSQPNQEVVALLRDDGTEAVKVKGTQQNYMVGTFPAWTLADDFKVCKSSPVDVDIGQTASVHVLFPHFSMVEYDFVLSVVQFQPDTSSASLGAIDIILICVGGGSAVMIVAMIIGFMVWRRHRITTRYITIY